MNFPRKNSLLYSLWSLNSQRGFTFIELLVVTGLMAVVLGGSVAGYRTFNTRQIVITSGKELLVALRQAQSKASSGVKTVQTCQNVQLIGYTVRVLPASLDTYTVSEVYASNCVSAGSAEFISKTEKLPAGVLFQGGFTATFTGLSGGVNFTGANPLTIRVCNRNCASGSLQYTISISRSGLVQDLGAQ